MKAQCTEEQGGVTLIELLVVIAILSLVLGGLYGLLDAANKSYRDTRALVERQQTARQVLNYVLYRLREIDGSGLVKDPRYCEDCHTPEIDDDPSTNANTVPCVKDVRIPRRTVYLNLSTANLTTLPGVDGVYQQLAGANTIDFWADLLPLTAPHDEFTDSPSSAASDTTYASYRNGEWDLISALDDKSDTAGKYDPGQDAEVLYYDLNDDGDYDYYGEHWTFGLEFDPNSKTFLLVESLSFDMYSSYNRSIYSAYTTQPVAYGLTGFGIQPVLRYAPGSYPANKELEDTSCGASAKDGSCHGNAVDISGQTGCGGSGSADNCWLNIYDNETSFSYKRFVETHDWWNIKALSIEIATTEPQQRKFMKIKQLLIPRNLEVNQEYYNPD